MTNMQAKSPIDLIAFAPIALGFTPVDSIVMLTIGGPQAFHARLDMPTDDVERHQASEALLNPAKRYDTPRAVFLFYGDDIEGIDAAWSVLRFDFLEAGIDIVDGLRITGDTWASLTNSDIGGSMDAVRDHPFTVRAAVENGVVVRKSRDDLRADLAPRDTLDEGWVPTPFKADAHADTLITEKVMLIDLLKGRAEDDRTLTSAELGTLYADVVVGNLRDTVTALIARDTDNSKAYASMFADATARAPQQYRAVMASIFAWASLMAGDGAAAWVGVDASREADPTNTLADIIHVLLERAITPKAAAEFLLSAMDD